MKRWSTNLSANTKLVAPYTITNIQRTVSLFETIAIAITAIGPQTECRFKTRHCWFHFSSFSRPGSKFYNAQRYTYWLINAISLWMDTKQTTILVRLTIKMIQKALSSLMTQWGLVWPSIAAYQAQLPSKWIRMGEFLMLLNIFTWESVGIDSLLEPPSSGH